ncbi:hypothetical protein A1Q2_03227 [Trichosporon asahii var. asahii CBS 8904]|uniref:Uncharacterized protein n=2 Tax=Trichosporon asahii var. asahii TaxID=189963 RepID=K1VSD3_TRIAC|nr:hypothetical protein A1Q1_06717 [Trichosporon asahii var. asahii CBS 2479]EJT52004.1 hypothetical protein A1Q1_06717 [Trichosporon asahii var. asahii CBS 2479]EKD02467.1 hypothetical protein A1Q2_03227 [Trichosporon asahii var. asahii CBS 8904]
MDQARPVSDLEAGLNGKGYRASLPGGATLNGHRSHATQNTPGSSERSLAQDMLQLSASVSEAPLRHSQAL